MKANIEIADITGELEIESKEAQEILNYMIPGFFKDSIGIINDLVKSWRWKNQIKILQMSQNFLLDNGLKASPIPLKILIPLLETSSLEEDDTLQKKWAKLLAYASSSNEFEYTKSFMNVLEQLTVLEVKILDYLDIDYEQNKKNLFHVDKICENFGIEKNKLLMVFSNLVRLGLITQKNRGTGINVGAIPVVNIRPTNQYILSDFGMEFLKTCKVS